MVILRRLHGWSINYPFDLPKLFQIIPCKGKLIYIYYLFTHDTGISYQGILQTSFMYYLLHVSTCLSYRTRISCSRSFEILHMINMWLTLPTKQFKKTISSLCTGRGYYSEHTRLSKLSQARLFYSLSCLTMLFKLIVIINIRILYQLNIGNGIVTIGLGYRVS